MKSPSNDRTEEIRYLLTGVSAPVTCTESELHALAEKRFRRVSELFTDVRLEKRSIDARHRSDVRFVCSFSAALDARRNRLPEQILASNHITRLEEPATPIFRRDCRLIGERPVIIGFGPAGMFAALVLAEAGLKPLVLERGPSITERTEAVSRFLRGGGFSPDANIQFGAGGAGTFSDGKLMTRTNDPYCRFVLRTLVDFGAPASILVDARPHIGTDLLREIIRRIDQRVRLLGGEICYEARVDRFITDSCRIRSLVLANGDEVPCGPVILAIGHSARDTYRSLQTSGVLLVPKSFSVGTRIEHRQSAIDESMFGEFAGLPGVPHAEYNLSTNTSERGVYTFCMCPGGTVIAAASEPDGIVTNGMSDSARNGMNANAAVAVTVRPDDYGGTVERAIAFQQSIEQTAFRMAGSNYSAPVSTVGFFLGRTTENRKGSVEPTYRGGDVVFSDLTDLFPPFISDGLRDALVVFGGKIKGYDSFDAILTAPETRTSSPVRIPRQDNRVSEIFANLYPVGEGAGYAGGIMSASIDGIRSAEALIEHCCTAG